MARGWQRPVTMEDCLWEDVKEAAVKSGCSAAEYVRRCIRTDLERLAVSESPETMARGCANDCRERG